LEIRTRGISPETAIAELEEMRSAASTATKPLGTNALSKHIKEARESAARTAQGHAPFPAVSTTIRVMHFCANHLYISRRLSIRLPTNHHISQLPASQSADPPRVLLLLLHLHLKGKNDVLLLWQVERKNQSYKLHIRAALNEPWLIYFFFSDVLLYCIALY
jgi:hypothetical protein